MMAAPDIGELTPDRQFLGPLLSAVPGTPLRQPYGLRLRAARRECVSGHDRAGHARLVAAAGGEALDPLHEVGRGLRGLQARVGRRRSRPAGLEIDERRDEPDADARAAGARAAARPAAVRARVR